MFNFFKKKEKKIAEPILSMLKEEEKSQLNQEIMLLQEKISTEDPNANYYEALGLKQATLGEIELAIASLEKSLSLEKSIGDGYKKLMNLYNTKRAESARNGDDAGIDYYMNKMDQMRQIAREMVVSGK